MSETDFSKERGVADELHINEFVQSVGGVLATPLITRPGVKSADYLFQDGRVVAELKILETEFSSQPNLINTLQRLLVSNPEMSVQSEAFQNELIKLLIKPLRRIISRANQQIKHTKIELGVTDYRGVIIVVNDEFRGLPPGFVMGLLARAAMGAHFTNTQCILYITNHYVELTTHPDALLLWCPQYAMDIDETSDLPNFINDLGRKWRAYLESQMGPFTSSEEQETMNFEQLSVATGSRRNTRYIPST